MDLEIKNIYSPDLEEDSLPQNVFDFNFPIIVEIGEKNRIGAIVFHFVIASPTGLSKEVSQNQFKILRGYVLLERFDWKIVHRTFENLINHSRHLETWDKIIEHWNRYGRYDSEDL